MRTREIMALILILGALLAVPAYSMKYVANSDDFKMHIQLHRQRVAILGRYLAEQDFPEVSTELIEEFLNLHDMSKTSKGTLKSLFPFYGSSHLDAPQLAGLKETIARLNSIDTAYASSFFDAHHFSSSERQKFLLIEKIADLVDRGMDVVAQEEFGKHRKMKLASEFLHDSNERALAERLESRYADLVRKHMMKFRCERAFYAPAS